MAYLAENIGQFGETRNACVILWVSLLKSMPLWSVKKICQESMEI